MVAGGVPLLPHDNSPQRPHTYSSPIDDRFPKMPGGRLVRLLLEKYLPEMNTWDRWLL